MESLLPKRDGATDNNLSDPIVVVGLDEEKTLVSPIKVQEPAKKPVENQAVFQIEVDKIVPNPHQPRREFDEAALRELASSIGEFGVIQPLVVTKVEKEGDYGTEVEYELIAGERRLMASRLAGLRTVPAIIRRPGLEREKLELAIIENIQRENLNPIEEARAYARLQDDFRLTQREVASRVGKSREAVANSLRLLNLPSEVQEAISAGKLTESQGRLLLAIGDINRQKQLFDEVVRGNMTVREIRRRVRGIRENGGEDEEVLTVAPDPELASLKEKLEEFFGTRVEVKKTGGNGQITINFYSNEELENILRKMLQEEKERLGGDSGWERGEFGGTF